MANTQPGYLRFDLGCAGIELIHPCGRQRIAREIAMFDVSLLDLMRRRVIVLP